MAFGDLLELAGIAPDKNGVELQAVAILQRQPALIADGADRAHQVLIIAHAASRSVNDDPETALRHVPPPFLSN